MTKRFCSAKTRRPTIISRDSENDERHALHHQIKRVVVRA